MVLVVEVLFGIGILAGVYAAATGAGHQAPPFEPDGRPVAVDDGPLSADDVAAFRLPRGVGYRKADVDRLLDRVARQLPRAGEEPTVGKSVGEPVGEPDGEPVGAAVTPTGPRVPLTKTSDRAQEDGHG